jgi:hypothetical protein
MTSKVQLTETGSSVSLFHPHQNSWLEHFSWSEDKTRLLAKSATARATIAKLQLNRFALVELRELWVAFGKFPP